MKPESNLCRRLSTQRGVCVCSRGKERSSEQETTIETITPGRRNWGEGLVTESHPRAERRGAWSGAAAWGGRQSTWPRCVRPHWRRGSGCRRAAEGAEGGGGACGDDVGQRWDRRRGLGSKDDRGPAGKRRRKPQRLYSNQRRKGRGPAVEIHDEEDEESWLPGEAADHAGDLRAGKKG